VTTYVDPEFARQAGWELDEQTQAYPGGESQVIEMSPYPDGDPLEGLDPTPQERLDFYRALDEQEAEEASYDLNAPWHDEDAGLTDDEMAAGLEAIGDVVDDAYQTAALVAAEDEATSALLTGRPSDEEKTAWALERIAAGTYTPPAYFRPRGQSGRYIATCGQADDLGHCMERYHQAGCESGVVSAAATGTHDDAQAWSATLRGYTPPPEVATAREELGLATPAPMPPQYLGWDELFSDTSPRDAHAAMLAELGAAEPMPVPPRQELPDVGGLRAALGL
jgi:hypothetical protein